MKEETAAFVNRITNPLSDVALTMNFGIADNEAVETSDKLRQADIDLLLVIPGIYVTSSVVMPVIRRTDVPMYRFSSPIHNRTMLSIATWSTRPHISTGSGS